MGAQEVQALWASMNARSAPAPPSAQPSAAPALPNVAAPADEDEVTWASLDAFVECVSRSSSALTGAAAPARRSELERLHALVKARVLPPAAHPFRRSLACAGGAA